MSTESPPTDPDQAGASHHPRACCYAVTSLVYGTGAGKRCRRGSTTWSEQPSDNDAARLHSFQFGNTFWEKRLFALTADGKTEYRRDSLTRYLVVEPDPSHRHLIKPVLKWGRPVYLWLCREERASAVSGRVITAKRGGDHDAEKNSTTNKTNLTNQTEGWIT